MASIFARPLKGVFTPHRKNTNESRTCDMPVPNEVAIVMSQHLGPPCNVLCAAGDSVKVGQVIGDSDALISAPVHSSVSGRVLRIDEIIMPNGSRNKAVVIETDKLQEPSPDILPPSVQDKDGFIRAVRASGLVGLGGAGFPTHIKFDAKNLGDIDTLIINAAECEPYITSDYRTLIEDADDVLAGIQLIMKHLGIPKAIIGIEDNKPAAIEKLLDMIKGDNRIEVRKLKSKYPQGAEKVLIYETTGRVVPAGKLPGDVLTMVVNVTTVAFLARYFRDGMPLVSKRVTVDGDAVAEPQNVRALIGTPIKDVIAFCGGFRAEPRKILMGGPMMGIAVYDENYPVLKNNNAILAFTEEQAGDYDESACIRCGRCVQSCPMNLMPLRIEDCFDRDDMDGLNKYDVNLCIECGCCAYACPARRHLVHVNKLAKVKLRGLAQKASGKGGNA